MFPLNTLDFEVNYRHQQVRTQFIESRRIVSIAGMRHLLGNSLMAFGSYIYGKAQESCQEAEASRESIRATMRPRRAAHAQ